MEIIVLVVFAILIFIFGAGYGWELRERYAKRMIDKLVSNIESEVKKVEAHLFHISIEKYEDAIYVYEKETSKFIARGNSQEELEKILKEKYPNKKFACSEDQLKAVGFLK
jgi:hypothetical protein